MIVGGDPPQGQDRNVIVFFLIVEVSFRARQKHNWSCYSLHLKFSKVFSLYV